MKRTRLAPKDTAKLLTEYNVQLTKNDEVELVEDEYRLIFINKQPAFFYYQEKVLPTLKYLQTNNLLKKITIDMGAVKFMINGADLMKPGITDVDAEIKEQEIIVLVDQNNKKPLALGIALFNSEQIKSMTHGKVTKNIHYVGDKIWNFSLK